MTREYYTPEGFAAMKRAIGVRAIEFWVWQQANEGESCLAGSAAEGFEFSVDHSPTAHADPSLHPLRHLRYPPVGTGSAGAQQVLVEYAEPDAPGELQGAAEDVWATRYQPWFDAVDEVFDGWDALPDERDFWAIADDLEARATPIRMNVEASDPRHIAENPELARAFNTLWQAKPSSWAGPTPDGRMTEDGGIRGRAVDVFYNTYVTGLPLVIGQQAVLLDLLAATARAEGDMWQKARRTVMEIGEAAVTAMGPERVTEADVAAFVNVVGDLMNVGGLFPEDWKINRLTNVTGLWLEGLNLYWTANPPAKPTRVETILSGATPETVIGKIRAALAETNRQITDSELDVQALARVALDGSYEPSDRRGVGVNLPPPQLLDETDPKQALRSIDMDHSDVRSAAGSVQAIGARLASVPAGLDAHGGTAPWQRPGHIGFTSLGPHDAWAALLGRAGEVITDTAGELHAAGDHLLLALDLVEGADQAARDAFDKHLRETEDVRAPEPVGPPSRGPEPRAGGPQP